MEEMIERWIRETHKEIAKAKANQNLLRMVQMKKLAKALMEMSDKLLKI